MSNKLSRRKILTMAGGFIAGTTTAGGLGLLGKVNSAAAQTNYGEYAKFVRVYAIPAA